MEILFVRESIDSVYYLLCVGCVRGNVMGSVIDPTVCTTQALSHGTRKHIGPPNRYGRLSFNAIKRYKRGDMWGERESGKIIEEIVASILEALGRISKNVVY